MRKEPIRIGFDFDGVVAYNPLRIFRRPAMRTLELLGKKKKSELNYPVPSKHPHRFIWAILHETSFFPAYGFSDLKDLMREKKIKGYLITGRYSFLRKSLMRWLKFRDIDDLFEELYLNDKDEQPHVYKEKMLKKLKLDLFVEDNWNIVEYLNSALNKEKKRVEVHWIYNILDRAEPYKYKHPHLKSFLDHVFEKKLV